MTDKIAHIVVAGGGVVGWTAAGMLARSLVGKACKITLIENSCLVNDALVQPLSSASNTVHKMLGLKEADIILHANATYRLGNRYVDWCQGVFHHTPNSYGAMLEGMSVADILTKCKRPNEPLIVENYSLAAQAMRANKFAHPRPPSNTQPQPMFAPYSYGLHVETALYLKLIKDRVSPLICVVDADVSGVQTHEHNGFIKCIDTSNGEHIEADFFIDATPNTVLTAQVADGMFTDLSAQLGCDCCISTFVTPAHVDESRAQSPSTTMQAHDSGWSRTQPLQDKVLIEFYYSSKELSYEDAVQRLIYSENLSPSADISFKEYALGRQSTFWSANCLSIGEAAGFIENLSVPIVHLVQSSLLRFMDFYPSGFQQSLCDEFNAITSQEYDRLMDFNSAHYYVAKEQDTAFWLRVKSQPLLASLEHKLRLFKARGRFPFYERETFSKDTWVSFLLGHQVLPCHYDPLLETHDVEKMKLIYQKMQHTAQTIVQSMPNHLAYVQQYLKAYQQHKPPANKGAAHA